MIADTTFQAFIRFSADIVNMRIWIDNCFCGAAVNELKTKMIFRKDQLFPIKDRVGLLGLNRKLHARLSASAAVSDPCAVSLNAAFAL